MGRGAGAALAADVGHQRGVGHHGGGRPAAHGRRVRARDPRAGITLQLFKDNRQVEANLHFVLSVPEN